MSRNLIKQLFFVGGFAVLVLGLLFVFQLHAFYDGKLHVIFCDVGQGDAILITTPNHKHILIDAGPDKRILDCLAKHLPFWERTIDLAILTHPHSDHYAGLYYVMQSYSITAFATENLQNKTAGFAELLRLLKDRQIPTRYVLAGDRWKIGEVTLIVAGPTKEFLTTTSPGGFIGESREFASVVTYLSYGSFRALLTGDSQVQGLLDAKEQIESPVTVLQVPHHGSSSGLDTSVLDWLQPKLAMISVGKNRYGHPTKTTLRLLSENNIATFRTDKSGTGEVVNDGKVWELH